MYNLCSKILRNVFDVYTCNTIASTLLLCMHYTHCKLAKSINPTRRFNGSRGQKGSNKTAPTSKIMYVNYYVNANYMREIVVNTTEYVGVFNYIISAHH